MVINSFALWKCPKYERNEPKIEIIVETNVVTTPEETSVKTSKEYVSEPIKEWVSLGEFKVTAYCGENYHHICNNGDATTTSTGTQPKANHTIAVDPRIIPYGSIVKIGDTEYVAEDCGGAIKNNRVDIFFDHHREALEYGIQHHEVFILKESV
jgi:3D (Asp-Asp-Asp) domain-containing protein